MYEEEREALRKKRNNVEKELRTLYAILNATATREPSEKERAREEEIGQLQDDIERLTQRLESIGGLGYGRYCPCCGLKIPYKYIKQLTEEKTAKTERLNELLSDTRDIYHEMEGNPVAEQIEKKEKELAELNEVISELGKAVRNPKYLSE